ncbi:permease-like cell division protein FtsX [Vallitalea okinawensis]|uniref:permease-like cell division protein FtsX n=1 Tax=Vallitalea okinawensis TaxID=2078660 RepID=UPI0014782372|nr:permease-like cell division protein FtsX [Vallitalea okinawensis]
MKIRTLQYSLVQGIKGLFKNRLMSAASIGIISACLFILGVSYCVLLNIDYMVENFDDTLSIVTFLEGGLTEDQVNNLLTDIKSDTNVKTVIYTSPEEAWNEFKGELDANEDILAELEKDNPLSDSASFEIFLYDASKQEDFVTYINTLSGIRDCYYSQESIDVIVNFSVLLQYISLVLISILLAIATLLIANTIKIGLFIRRHEINIMKYLGAKDSFIRLPFIIEGILIGLIGALIPFGIIYYSYDYLITIINDEFYMLNDFIRFVELSQIVSILGPVFLGIGIGIGIIGSFLSIRKHLRV